MAFPVIGGTQESGYNINNSLRFNSGDSPALQRTPSSAGNRKTWTLSMWFKRCDGSDRMVLAATPGSDNNSTLQLILHQNGDFRFGLNSFNVFSSNELFRDVSAWYHMVFSVDSTDGTASDRVKWYVNGTRITSFAADGFSSLSQNHDFGWNNTIAHTIGAESVSNDNMNGYIAEVNNIDGQALDASHFGETNDNGVWIPKNYTGSYGTNGFKLEFKQLGTAADATSIGADTSGNNNHFSQTNVTPAVDRTVDTPTNNFATMIPAPNLTISEGNLNFTHNRTGNWDGTAASMGVQNGKWYYEAKLTSTDSTPRHNIGFAGNPETWTVVVDGKGGSADPTNNMTNAYWFHSDTNSVGYLNKTGTYGPSVSQWGIASGDIVGVALDMDNQKIYFHKNGTYYGADGNSSDPTNGTNPAYSSITTGIHYRPFLMVRNDGSETNTISMNFGNPSFSISSGNADANGYGNFEYAVPSGYYSLCTKNLAEYG